jgi:hypothetical protein
MKSWGMLSSRHIRPKALGAKDGIVEQERGTAEETMHTEGLTGNEKRHAKHASDIH